MGWGLLQNCSKGEAGGTDAIFSVTSDKVTMELEKHVTAFTSFCTEGEKKNKTTAKWQCTFSEIKIERGGQ